MELAVAVTRHAADEKLIAKNSATWVHALLCFCQRVRPISQIVRQYHGVKMPAHQKHKHEIEASKVRRRETRWENDFVLYVLHNEDNNIQPGEVHERSLSFVAAPHFVPPHLCDPLCESGALEVPLARK